MIGVSKRVSECAIQGDGDLLYTLTWFIYFDLLSPWIQLDNVWNIKDLIK